MAIIKERHSGQRVMVQKVIRGKNRIFFFSPDRGRAPDPTWADIVDDPASPSTSSVTISGTGSED